MNKEQNFISAVVYICDDGEETINFFKELNKCLEEHFLQYELIAVNGGGTIKSTNMLKEWAKSVKKPITLINMSFGQPHEQCMNAGIDISIGDYVYEFDSVKKPYSITLIWDAYQTAMRGNDIVTVCPKKSRKSSEIFYYIFNKYSNSQVKLRTDAFRLTSRRAINRAHAISENLPYRKAAYASCGLKMETLEFEGNITKSESNKFELAIDSLVLYTDFGYRFSIGLTMTMVCVALAELLYTIVIWMVGKPIQGWTTTMFVLSFGLVGNFAILAIAMKYLSLVLKLSIKKQSYQIEDIEKL